jgi:hypothetical protein
MGHPARPFAIDKQLTINSPELRSLRGYKTLTGAVFLRLRPEARKR